ncbi:HAD family hydrolase [Rhizobium changzhiense]|uniref:HAD family hydrolase n=1 Tax=Rhizobium changzhiense TaxID=2692317 RepID=UPI001FD14EB4|nr:HAD family hydrolase [Rhizobium changzhiense]
MIRAVLFDLDETLIDKTATVLTFLPLQYQRFRLGEHGVDEQRYIAEFLQLEKAGLVRKRDLYPRLVETFGLPGELAEALFRDFETVYPGMAVPMSGAKQTISALKQYGVLVGVVSNGEGNVQRPKIAAAGLNEGLDLVVISGDIGLRKPEREIFELAVGRLHLPVDSCLFVGDNPRGRYCWSRERRYACRLFRPEKRLAGFAALAAVSNRVAAAADSPCPRSERTHRGLDGDEAPAPKVTPMHLAAA